jgi:hypothetical protein
MRHNDARIGFMQVSASWVISTGNRHFYVRTRRGHYNHAAFIITARIPVTTNDGATPLAAAAGELGRKSNLQSFRRRIP